MIVIEENDDFLSCYMEIAPEMLTRLMDDGDVIKIAHCNTAVSSIGAVLRIVPNMDYHWRSGTVILKH